MRDVEARRRAGGELGSVPAVDGSTASAQAEMLRTSMTLHSAGSLMMELARLISSVHVNGAASEPPPFMSNFARQHEQAQQQQQQQAGGGDVTDALAPTLAAVQGFLAPPLMYLDPRGGTQPLSGLSMRPSIQQAGLHNMPGVQIPASFADAVANGVNARQRMSVNVAAGRPMPATMGDANAEANLPGGGVEAFMTNMIDQALGDMIGSMADRVQSGIMASVDAVAQTNDELTGVLTQILERRVESGEGGVEDAERLRDMLQRHRDERRAAMDRARAINPPEIPTNVASMPPAQLSSISLPQISASPGLTLPLLSLQSLPWVAV